MWGCVDACLLAESECSFVPYIPCESQHWRGGEWTLAGWNVHPSQAWPGETADTPPLIVHTFFLSCTATNLCWFILSSIFALPSISVGSYFLPFLHCHLSLLIHTFFLSETDCHLWLLILSSFFAMLSIFVGSILSSFLKLTVTSDGLYFLPFTAIYLCCSYFVPFSNWQLSLMAHTFFLSCTAIYLCRSCFLPFWNWLLPLMVNMFFYFQYCHICWFRLSTS